jgi:predicted metal-dependent hydrolase
MDKVLVLFLFFVFIFSFYFLYSKPTEIQEIKPILNQIINYTFNDQGSFPGSLNYKIYHSSLHSFTKNKQEIYLFTGNYNQDTILFVALHEIAHIICEDQHHTDKFYELEKVLHQNAVKLGFIDVNKIDKSYPCMN